MITIHREIFDQMLEALERISKGRKTYDLANRLSDTEMAAIADTALAAAAAALAAANAVTDTGSTVQPQTMELPEPQKYPAECFMREVYVCDALAVSIAIQQAHAIGYAKGAADQLAAEPTHYLDESGWCHTAERAELLGFDKTQLTPLYTRKEPK